MFGFGKNKKHNQANQSNSQKNGSKGGTPVVHRKKHLFGGPGSQYPVIKALKIPEQVPSAILDTLSIQADDEDGAVRKVAGGYAVITLDEKTLEEQGLVPKNKSSDFGQFSASLRKKDNITSTTLKGDLDHGIVVMAPNEHTLESLDEFDQLRNGAQFGWAVFPDDLEDDDLNAHVKELSNTVELADLTQISENEWNLKLADNKMIVDKSESDDEDDYDDDDYDDDDEYETNDDEYEANDDADNPTASAQPKSSASANQNDQQAKTSAQQVFDQTTVPDSQHTSQDNTENNNNNDNSQDQNNQNGQVNNDNNQDVDPSEPPSSLNTQSNSSLDTNANFWQNILHGSVPSQGEKMPSTGANENPTQPNVNNNQMTQQGQNNTNDSSQNSRLNGNSLDFQTTVGKVNVQQLYDQDLDLHVDTNVFNQMFDQSKAFEVAPLKTDAKSTELFKHVIQEARADANNKLRNLNERHRQRLIQLYIDRVQQMIADISNKLEINNANTSVGQTKQNIEAIFRQQLANQDVAKTQESEKLQDKYNQQRNEAGEQARLQAQQAFDEQHSAELQRHIQQISQQVESSINDERVMALHDLNDKRKQAAVLTYKNINAKILHDMQDLFTKMRNQEADLANTYEQNLQQTITQLYRDDVKRQQAIAETKEHDKTIDRVQDEKKRLVEDQQSALASIKQENKDALDDLATQYQAAHKKVVASYDAKIDAQDKQLQVKDNEYKKLQADIAAQIKQRTEDIKSDYQARLDHAQNRYKDLQVDLKDARQQNLMDAKEHAEREKLQAQQYDQFKKDNKRSPWANSIAIGCVALLIGAGGMFVVQHQLGFPASKVQSNKGNQTPNITINGTGSSHNSSSSSSAESESHEPTHHDTHRDYGNSHVSVDKSKK